MSYIEAYSEPGPVISANGNSQSVITFNGIVRAFVEVTGIGPQGPKGDTGDTGSQGEQGEPGVLAAYQKLLPAGISITIPQSEHGLTSVTGITAIADNNQVADVLMEIQPDMDVMIQTNVSFENYKITIF